mmetsp:Transcript_6167/g.5532  ORF Transcript_6167/g.5532 Transcript_6167/m.5532 type:complete len:235 (+) Transcript_6167:226-930(+)
MPWLMCTCRICLIRRLHWSLNMRNTWKINNQKGLAQGKDQFPPKVEAQESPVRKSQENLQKIAPKSHQENLQERHLRIVLGSLTHPESQALKQAFLEEGVIARAVRSLQAESLVNNHQENLASIHMVQLVNQNNEAELQVKLHTKRKLQEDQANILLYSPQRRELHQGIPLENLASIPTEKLQRRDLPLDTLQESPASILLNIPQSDQDLQVNIQRKGFHPDVLQSTQIGLVLV